ncbi:MAG: cellulase family glycosylhydrolase [Deltaproteobacteria bacterium]|nr:cellulase family glycosylhydrolase [Deltaproteobacteria bacterium]
MDKDMLNRFVVITVALFSAAVFSGCSGSGKSAAAKALHTDGQWLKDQYGRVVILRGINAGGDSKIPPFIPFTSETSAQQIKNWGMNFVRYVTVWEALEPTEGVYNTAYLDDMSQRVNWLTSKGIYVFIDMHQDLFTRGFCGDGAPQWAATGDPSQLSVPYPSCGQNWFLNYLSPPVMQSFTRFWTDTTLQSHFINAFKLIASKFKNNNMVVGYEIFNEPWNGYFTVSTFEQDYLAPFYQKVIDAIRPVDPGAIIFFEPYVFYGDLGQQSNFPKLYDSNIVYAPHYYVPGTLTGAAITNSIDQALTLVQQKAQQLGTPVILGEFGGATDIVIQSYYNMLDKHLMGGTIWDYAVKDTWNNEGASLVNPDMSQKPYVNALIRPYPMAIAGIPTLINFSPATEDFRLEFNENGITAPTVIYIPPEVYQTGISVQISDGIYNTDTSSNELYFTTTGSVQKHWIQIIPAI